VRVYLSNEKLKQGGVDYPAALSVTAPYPASRRSYPVLWGRPGGRATAKPTSRSRGSADGFAVRMERT